jgi:hypothetical protein
MVLGKNFDKGVWSIKKVSILAPELEAPAGIPSRNNPIYCMNGAGSSIPVVGVFYARRTFLQNNLPKGNLF